MLYFLIFSFFASVQPVTSPLIQSDKDGGGVIIAIPSERLGGVKIITRNELVGMVYYYYDQKVGKEGSLKFNPCGVPSPYGNSLVSFDIILQKRAEQPVCSKTIAISFWNVEFTFRETCVNFDGSVFRENVFREKTFYSTSNITISVREDIFYPLFQERLEPVNRMGGAIDPLDPDGYIATILNERGEMSNRFRGECREGRFIPVGN